ncbi:MAG: hypothetical protein ACQESR_23280 [Planctomycetota bacterium]
MIAANVRVREREARAMATHPPSCQVGCRLFNVEDVVVAFLLFRFDDHEQAYISTINLCDGFTIEPLLHELANGEPLVVFLFENEPEPIVGWDLELSREPWTSLLRATAEHGTWSEQDFQTALRVVLSNVDIEQLWDWPPAPHVSSLPKVRTTSTSEDLAETEESLREAGMGELVDALGRAIRERSGPVDICTHLTNVVLTSGKDHFAMGILGQPSAGKRTLAKNLSDQLQRHARKAATVFVDDCYYIEPMPGIRMRRGNLARDIREFQEGAEVYVAGGDRIESGTTVLLLLATLKYLPEDLAAWEALDYLVFVTARHGQERLRRRIELETKPKEEGGPGRSEGEVIGEFTQDQLREHATVHMIRQADCVWLQDTNQIGRF